MCKWQNRAAGLIKLASGPFFWVSVITAAVFAFKPGSLEIEKQLSDKLLHGMTFFTMSILRCYGGCHGIFTGTALVFAVGVLIEGVQYFLPHREASIGDIAANSAGIAAFILIRVLRRGFGRVKLTCRSSSQSTGGNRPT